MASPKSANGIARTAKGKSSGKVAGPSFSAEIALGSTWPVKVIADAANISPKNIEPESPIKMVAGCELWARKPTQTPTKIAVINDGEPARLNP
jgi:hypothetical protein